MRRLSLVFVFAAAVAAYGQGITQSSNPYPNAPADPQMRKLSPMLPWYAALNDDLRNLPSASGKAVNIASVGDSISYGIGNTAPNFYLGWVHHATARLQQKYGVNSQSNNGFAWWYANASGTSLANTFTQSGAGWFSLNGVGPSDSVTSAYMTWGATGNTNTASLTFVGSSIQLFLYTYVNSAAPAVTLDGAAQTGPCASTTSNYTSCTATFTAAAWGSHTLVVTAPASGFVYLLGAFASAGNNQGVGLVNVSVGSQTSSFVAAPAQFNFLLNIPNLQLIIYGMDENDIFHSTAAQYRANVDAFFSWASSNNIPLIALATEWPVTECALSCRHDLDQVLKDEATSYGYPFLSIHDHWGSNTFAATYGLYASDLLHPSAKGHQELGDWIGTFLQGNQTFHQMPDMSNNSGIRAGSLQNLTTGANNAALPGYFTLYGLTTGSSDTAGGNYACYHATTSSNSTCIGDHAGATVTTEQGDTFYGAFADIAAAGLSNVGEIGPGLASHANTLHYRGVPLINTSGQVFASQVNTPGVTIGAIASPTFSLAAGSGSASGTLAASTSYCYRVSSTSSYGESVPAAEQCVTTSSGTGNYVTVTWNGVNGAAGYNVYGRTTAAELKLTPTALLSGSGSVGTGFSNSFNDTGLLTPSGALPTTDTTLGGNVPRQSQVAFIAGNVTSTSRSTALGAFTLYTTTASAVYRISGTAVCDSSSAGATITVTVAWTDPGSTAQTLSSSSIACTTLGAASTGSVVATARAKTGTTITISSAIAGTPTYDISGLVEQLTQN